MIAERVLEEDRVPPELKLACGVDVSYVGDYAIAAAVVVDARTLSAATESMAITKVAFPYIPTLLAFREAGPMVGAVQQLGVRPDVVLVDGNGRLHPLGAGVACHVGLALGLPTIGVAKKLLCGRLGEWRGDEAPVVDDQVIGLALRLGSSVTYVSVGHMVSLPTAARIVCQLTRKGERLPEPLRLAHFRATLKARELRASSRSA